MDELIGRIPPQDLEAEQSILGAIIVDNQTFKKACKIISSTDFYKQVHGKIFEGMVYLDQQKEPIDLISLNNYFKQNNELEIVGGNSYLFHLASSVPTTANISYHAKLVKEASQKRQVLNACSELTDSIYEGYDVNEELLKHRAKLLTVLNPSGSSLVSMANIALKAQEYIEARSLKKDAIHGIPSGFIDLDNITDGFQKGDLIIIGGRPSMGKSCFAINIIENCNVAAGVISLEMTGIQIGIRTVASLSGININSLRKGFIQKHEWDDISSATSKMSNMLTYFSFSARKAADIEKQIIELVEDKGAEIIIVDYLQLIKGDNSKQREREIAAISVMLKGLAVDFNIPIIALAQLNREVEYRENKRPNLSDLRESGAIEQDADIVMFLYRDEYYHKDTIDKGLTEIIIAKGRNIGTDVIKLQFTGDRMSFRNYYKGREV